MTVITMSRNELSRLRVLIDVADGRARDHPPIAATAGRCGGPAGLVDGEYRGIGDQP